ncbi:MAG TPA: trans-4-hydroxy-L-proline dehydratase [Bacteroidota bacterium]
MTERVQHLRKQSIDATPALSAERAVFMTEFYQRQRFDSIPLQRAHAFKELMERKTVCINDGELIVGERGAMPKDTPTFPELCCHTLEDLDTLDTREKVWFRVDEHVRATYRDVVIPFWEGRTMRERLFSQMTDEWLAAYRSGMFTEFMEQRGPGHTVLDGKIYVKGMHDFQKDIERSLENLDFGTDPEANQKQHELKAMHVCAEALITFARRHAELARTGASETLDAQRRRELDRIAEVCTRVPVAAPRNFWEALQYYWFVHLGVITELNPWDAFNPGRLDQHLYPFYTQGLADGSLTRKSAKELLECFWIKFNNQPAPPKVGITAAESATYTDFANINSGGLKADGSDGVNELTFLILEVIDEMQLVQPSTNIQLSRKNPDEFLKRACQVVRKGWGQPSIFNADKVVEELLLQGKSIEDARCGGTSGCVETGAFGKESYILTGYLNFAKVLEITLNNGIDPLNGVQVGAATGDPWEWKTFDDALEAYRRQLEHLVDIKIRGNSRIEQLFAELMPVPFLSILIDDCIRKGKDYNNGGARYSTSYIQGVGLGTVTDSLTAIRCHVFDKRSLSMEALLAALADNFVGHEKTRLMFLNKTPKYGNDEDYTDEVMQKMFEFFYRSVDGRKNTVGGVYHINLLPTTCHIYFGSMTGATPDGRKSRSPLSEGISPVQGSDRRGPTAVLKSASKLDHARTGGTLLNQKLNPGLIEGEHGISNMVHLVRSYFKLGGHHIQFNVTTAQTLLDAQANPEQYRDLIVRVAGYSDYFCELGKDLQDEIISRTEHQEY